MQAKAFESSAEAKRDAIAAKKKITAIKSIKKSRNLELNDFDSLKLDKVQKLMGPLKSKETIFLLYLPLDHLNSKSLNPVAGGLTSIFDLEM